MTAPAQLAKAIEEHPRLPAGNGDRVSGYGVMGLPFRSGHVLGLRRWTASSVGEPFTSVWHRDPAGRWTFYESARSEVACTRYFGAGVDRVRVGPIGIEWTGSRRLHVHTVDDDAVEWSVELGSTPVTRAMSAVGSALPASVWHSHRMLTAMGRVAGRALRVDTVKLTGMTPNGQTFEAHPRRIWFVTDSQAVVEGQDLGSIGRLPEQAHLSDFHIPQRGVFAAGRVFVTP